MGIFICFLKGILVPPLFPTLYINTDLHCFLWFLHIVDEVPYARIQCAFNSLFRRVASTMNAILFIVVVHGFNAFYAVLYCWVSCFFRHTIHTLILVFDFCLNDPFVVSATRMVLFLVLATVIYCFGALMKDDYSLRVAYTSLVALW